MTTHGSRTNEDRRRLLKAGAALSFLPLAPAGWSSAAAAVAPARSAFHKIIYDRRHLAGAAFALAATRAGLTVQSIEGDVTRLWSDDLYQHWRAEPLATGGLTTESAAYCLEVFARDAGLRTIFRTLHASGARIGEAQSAHLVSRMLTAQAEPGRPMPLDYAPSLMTASDEPLVAWVIAPVGSV